MADVLSDDDILVYSAPRGAGGQTVQAMAAADGVSVYSRALGVGVSVTSEPSRHANKAEALRLLRMIAAEKMEAERPFVCPGCHAVAPERCLPGCIDAEIEAEHEAREYEASEDGP